MKVAVVGAPATGKTQLTRDLALHLNELQVIDAPSSQTLIPGVYDRVLLLGLDLTGATPAQQEADATLRAQLAAAGVSYGVVYGRGRDRLRAALRLIEPQDGPAPRWTGVCEKCADPDCEFRLFTALKHSKAAGPAPS